MAVRQRRRTTDATQTISAAIDAVFSCANFHPMKFSLPDERGAQMSMTGDVAAIGNGGDFHDAFLVDALRSFPAMRNTSESELLRYSKRRRFTLLCGDCDRSVAILGAIVEMVKNGVTKILITADTPVERDNLLESLQLMRAGLGDVAISAYRGKEFDASAHYKAYASIYGFLTSGKPEIFLLSRDAFSRKSNILRRTSGEKAGEKSLSDLLRDARPVVIASSETVYSARTLARNASVFKPAAVFLFAGEERPLRDCVIYKPDHALRKNKKDDPRIPEQLGF